MKKSGKNGMRVLSLFLMLAMLVSLVNVNTADAKEKEEKNVVVLYFSATGTTKGAAKKIKKATKGTLIAIEAAEPYTKRI